MKSNGRRNRILLGQLVKNGDCLHATILARQIKNDFPGCHLTWAVSSLCRAMVENNPYVDAIWEVSLRNWDEDDQIQCWFDFEQEAARLYRLGRYDFVFLTQIHIANPHLFDGTIRPSLFRAYPGKITVPMHPVIELREDEKNNVCSFVQKHLQSFLHVILIESTAMSAQSQMNPEKALEIACEILDEHQGRYAVICSAKDPVRGPSRRGLIDGSVLSLREMAGLVQYCDLFIGCNSGITQAITSARIKDLPMIQVLSKRRSIYASPVYDLKYWHLPHSHILEIFDADVPHVVRTVKDHFALGWEETRRLHHQEVPEDFTYLIDFIKVRLIDRNDLLGFTISLTNSTQRYGWRKEFDDLLRDVCGHVFKGKFDCVESEGEENLRRLEAHALDPATYGDLQSPYRTGQFINQYPLSLRGLSCLIQIRRSAREAGEILTSLASENAQRKSGEELKNLIMNEACDELFHRYEKHPEDLVNRGALILAWMQSGQYEQAAQWLGSWAEESGSVRHFLFDEWRGDLAWMLGDHDQVAASYQAVLHEHPERYRIKQKLDAFLRAENSGSDVTEPDNLSQVCLVLHDAESRLNADSEQIRGTAELSVRHQLDFALAGKAQEFTGTTTKNLELLPLEMPGEPKGKDDAKALLVTAMHWAKRKRKKWLVLAHDVADLHKFNLVLLQNELKAESAPNPVYSWKINRSLHEIPFALSKRSYFYPCLIVLPTDWAESHLKEFKTGSLKKDLWLLNYAATILNLIEKEKLYKEGDAKQSVRVQPATLGWVFPAWLARLKFVFKKETIMLLAWKLNKCRFRIRTLGKWKSQLWMK